MRGNEWLSLEAVLVFRSHGRRSASRLVDAACAPYGCTRGDKGFDVEIGGIGYLAFLGPPGDGRRGFGPERCER
jgi:hypothetical protein